MPNPRGNVRLGEITIGSDPVFDKLWEDEPNKDLPTQPDDPNRLMTFIRQFGQGVAGDFVDEAAGAVLQNLGPSGRQGLEAVQRTLSGEEVTPEERLARQTAAANLGYRDFQQAGQEISNRDREENPITSIAGNVVGGLAAGFTGAGRVGSMGATPLRTAASARRGSQTLAQAGGTTSYGTEILRRLPSGFAVGATQGTITGLGGSQGNLDTEEGREALVEDARRGGIIGGGFGIVAGAAGGAANAYLNRARNTNAGMPPTTEDVPGELLGNTPAQTAERLQTATRRIDDQLLHDPTLENTDVPPEFFLQIRRLADRTLSNLGSGVQPRLKRIAKNIGIANEDGFYSFAQLRSYMDELDELARNGSTEAQRLRSELDNVYRDAIQVSRRDATVALRNVENQRQRMIDNVNRDGVGSTINAQSNPNIQAINEAANNALRDFSNQAEGLTRILQNQQVKQNLQRYAEAFQREMSTRQGSTPFGVSELMQRYAGLVLTDLPLAFRDVEMFKPWIARFFSYLVPPTLLSPQVQGIAIGQVRTEPIQPEPIVDETEIQMMPEEASEVDVRETRAQEIEAELQRRNRIKEIEAELERRRSQTRSLRSERRRQRRVQ